MEFKFLMPTKVFLGKDCINKNKAIFQEYGKKAFIVTGKYSGKSSGALDAVVNLLTDLGISYKVFDGVENNPSLENVKIGGSEAAKFGADFIIGIGGGSPLDASKAVAVLAVNDIDPLELYKNVFTIKPLPIVAVPTTAGTGSEVTPYSILTRNDMQTKMSFGNEDTFPKVAFLDAAYTESLPHDVTVNTAVDALSHAVEGYLSNRSMPVSDIIAIDAISTFGKCMHKLKNRKYDFDLREKLLYASMLAGIVITHTGTTIVHGMGYSLTYFKGLPHGKANGILMKEYLKFNYEAAKAKIENVLRLLGMKSIEEFGEIIDVLMGEKVSVTEDELELYASLAMKQRSTSFNIREVAHGDMVDIMKNSLR
jgi:alcohol dehydrogenase class IV